MKLERRVRAPTRAPGAGGARGRRPKDRRLGHALPIAGLAAGLLAAPLIGHLESPRAFAECNPGRTDNGDTYRVGTHRLDIEATAVRANIIVRDTWVKPGDHVAHGYVELSSTTRRVGVGWLEFDDNERHLAVRWSLSNFDSYWYDIPQAVVVNSSPFFAIWEAFATDEFVFYVNSDEKWRLPRDHPPFTMFTPDRAQIYGHIDTLASQMPGTGTPGAKESFSNAELRIGTGSLEDFNGAEYNPSSAYFGMEKISGRTYQTWDKYC